MSSTAHLWDEVMEQSCYNDDLFERINNVTIHECLNRAVVGVRIVTKYLL